MLAVSTELNKLALLAISSTQTVHLLLSTRLAAHSLF